MVASVKAIEKQTQRTRDLARAALLRERILGALRAAPSPMAIAELYGMSGIADLYHKSMIPQKVGQQVRALLKSGEVVKIAFGQYAIGKRQDDAQRAPQQGDALQHLQIEIDKKDSSVAFTLNGVRISVKVL